jgi:3-oxoacyl-[acyl-carrier protein] reductase
LTRATSTPHALVLGATGLVGDHVCQRLADEGFSVTKSSSRRHENGAVWLTGNQNDDRKSVQSLPLLDAVVWAQGTNSNDNISNVDVTHLRTVLDTNLVFVVATLQALLVEEKIRDGARMVVISSIWEQIARSNKLSYTISKAGLGGLVRAAAADLASKNIKINAVLPGVLDGPMTRSVLTSDQLQSIRNSTNFCRLPTPQEVASVVAFLCSSENSSITGQSITVDLGFSFLREI